LEEFMRRSFPYVSATLCWFSLSLSGCDIRDKPGPGPTPPGGNDTPGVVGTKPPPSGPLSDFDQPVSGPGTVATLGDDKPSEDSEAASRPSGPKPPRPPLPAEEAPPASPRLPGAPPIDQLKAQIESRFKNQPSRRFYIQTDKPIYKPGETVWIKAWDLTTGAFSGSHNTAGMYIELVSPRGAQVAKKKARESAGMAQAEFDLAAGIAGGEYTLRLKTLDGKTAERPIVVASYEPPRLKMKLEFVRKAYGPGDEVSATFEVKRTTGEPLRNHALSAMVRLDGQDLPRVNFQTDAQGEAVVRFNLPAEIALGDGLLTVLADESGLTESIARRIPIIVKKLQFASYPEGGDLLVGVAGRVYFEAKNPLGKPADISGRVVDDTGAIAARFTSVRDGLGRFDLTPALGRVYHVEIDRPVGVTDQYALPAAKLEGCSLRSFDDLDGQLGATRVSVRCAGSAAKKVLVSAVVRENLLDSASVEVPAGAPAVVYLEPRGLGSEAIGRAQGVTRVTVFDEAQRPLAERLIYRQRRARMGVKVTPDKKSYVPRDRVSLEVLTSDAAGRPIPADVALSVVDDTVLAFADDKTGHILSRLYLEPELPGKIEEPNFYFDLSEEKSALAMDLLMGTRGYRRFEWLPSTLLARGTIGTKASTGRGHTRTEAGADLRLAEKAPHPDRPADVAVPAPRKKMAMAMPKAPRPMAKLDEDDALVGAGDQARDREAPANAAKKDAAAAVRKEASAPRPMPARAAAPASPPAMAAPVMAAQAPMAAAEAMAEPAKPMAAPKAEMADKAPEAKAAAGPRAGALAMGDLGAGAGGVAKNKGVARRADFDDFDGVDNAPIGWAERRRPPVMPRPVRPARPVETWTVARVFPTPNYAPGYSGPRNDFRETVFWQPAVQTGQDGKATVSFVLSDAVSSFRVLTEGVGSGAAGRDETVIKSSLPFSVAVKLPLEVSEGDRVMLPVVLSNEQNQPLRVDLQSNFGTLLTLEKQVARTSGTIGGGLRDTLYFPLSVSGKKGESEVRLVAETGGLRDELVRSVRVSPRGFPQHISRSGRMREGWNSDVLLAEAMPGTSDGQVRVYPSTLSTLVASVEGLLRHPVGCFEQASSVNYPNVMVLRFMKSEGVSDARLLGRASRLMDEGYKKLVGYETTTRGYEWFGGSPGHEALTAYGLMEFADMRPVYHDLDKTMLTRTAEWLMSRRDGTGGYARDAKALDSFGRASKQVTDAYITYALSEVKQAGLSAEIDVAANVAQSSDDAYLLALTTATLFNAGRRGPAMTGAKRLVSLQDSDGGWSKADHSITRSGGENLFIESTSLSLMALIKANSKDFDTPVERGIEWLMNHRRGYGAWGTTQATVLSLKALTAYAQSQARERTGGEVTLVVNGQNVATQKYDGDDRDPLVFKGLGQHLLGGKNHIEIKHSGRTPMPFSVAIDYRSLQPEDGKRANIDITTQLERNQVKLGESVRMRVTLRNKTDKGQPMTLGRVELPGGLTFQTWQLKELREKGLIAFYETGPRQVVLYLRDMKPKQTVELPLDLVAFAPGQYTAQASSAYLYYTDENKTWAAGTQITIDP
jgi:hypothetical protein